MLQPLWDKVVIQVIEDDEITAGGIVLPDTAKEKPKRGRVMAVGPGSINADGSRIEPAVKEGDEVVFSHYSGTEIEMNREKFLIVSGLSDILAIVK